MTFRTRACGIAPTLAISDLTGFPATAQAAGGAASGASLVLSLAKTF